MKSETRTSSFVRSKPNPVLAVISWFFGVLFMMTGISFMWDDAVFGVCYLMGGILLLPPMYRFMSKKLRMILFILLMVIISARILWSFWYLFFPAVPHLVK